MEAIARAYLPQRRRPPRRRPQAARCSTAAAPASRPSHLWFVDFDVVRERHADRGRARRLPRQQRQPDPVRHREPAGPRRRGAADQADQKRQALAAVAKYIGGFSAADTFRDAGSLHLLPANIASNRFADGFEFGNGRGLAKVWQFTFHRDGVMGTWRARVDAATGEVLELADVNEYAAAQVTGGIYLNSPTTGTEVVRPMPFANVSTGGFTNSAGIYNYTSGTVTSTLAGQYVKITDTCGAISQASDATGNIAFGTSTGTDCTTPGHGGAGNTHSSREQFYQVNRIKEVVRGWLPGNTWLNAQADRQRQPEPDLQRLLERLDAELLQVGRRLRQHR